jgi:hypothetical protein
MRSANAAGTSVTPTETERIELYGTVTWRRTRSKASRPAKRTKSAFAVSSIDRARSAP